MEIPNTLDTTQYSLTDRPSIEKPAQLELNVASQNQMKAPTADELAPLPNDTLKGSFFDIQV